MRSNAKAANGPSCPIPNTHGVSPLKRTCASLAPPPAAPAQLSIVSDPPGAEVIENGGYPTPVKRGSYVRQGRPGAPGYFILSAGGFSRQAPRGVYRVSVAEVVAKFRAGGLGGLA